MSNKGYWLKSGSYALFQRAAVFVFGFGAYFFLVRYYDKDSFGVWTLYVLVTSVFEMSRSAFVQNACIKFFNDPEMNREKVVTASFFLNLGSVLFFVIVILSVLPWLASYWNTDRVASLIYWYCASSVVLVPFTQINYIEQANQSFKGNFYGSVARQGSFFIVVAYVFLFKQEDPQLPLTFFAASQFGAAGIGLITVSFVSRKFLPKRYIVDWEVVGRIFRFARYIFGTGITSAMGKNIDQFILGSNHAVVAGYNAVIRIMTFVEVPIASISNIAYPKMAEKASLEGSKAAGYLYEQTVASMLFITVPFAVLVFVVPEWVLLITAGEKYTSVFPVLRIAAFVALLLPFNIQLGSAFEVIGRPQVGFVINLVSNILNLILALVLIKLYGIYGAVFALLITVLTIFLIGQYLLKKYHEVKFLRVFWHLGVFYKTAFREGYRRVLRKS